MSNATPVHWALEELGVPYEKVKLDLKAGEQRKSTFLSINPNGKIPAIMHDGVAIYESSAIIIYLGETFGVEKGLFPSLGPARGEALRWIAWCAVSLAEATSRFLRNTSARYSPEEQNKKAGEVAKQEIAHLLGILDKSLSGQQYLVENKFSLADVYASSRVSYLSMIGIDLSPYAAVGAWKDRCFARPANARVMGE